MKLNIFIYTFALAAATPALAAPPAEACHQEYITWLAFKEAIQACPLKAHSSQIIMRDMGKTRAKCSSALPEHDDEFIDAAHNELQKKFHQFSKAEFCTMLDSSFAGQNS